ALVVEPDREPLEIQDDVGDVLDDARHGGELVLDALDLDGRDRRALDGREEHAPERVPDRRAPAAPQPLGGAAAGVALLFLGIAPVRPLKSLPKHLLLQSALRLIRCAARAGPLRTNGYFEYSSTISFSWTGSATSSRFGTWSTLPWNSAAFSSSHAGTPRP